MEQVLKAARTCEWPLIFPTMSFRTVTLAMSLSPRSMLRCHKIPHTRGRGHTNTAELRGCPSTRRQASPGGGFHENLDLWENSENGGSLKSLRGQLVL